MGGRGETVGYSRFFYKKLNNNTRNELKAKINDIIDNAEFSLTIIALEGDDDIGNDDRYGDFSPDK